MFDGAFVSHLIFWLIGAMSVGAVIASCGAMIAMARATNRKD